MQIKIFSDGANINEMLDINKNPIISGFTTNPTLMYKAGIPNYKVFSQHVLKEIKDKPISFEIFADDFDEMERHEVCSTVLLKSGLEAVRDHPRCRLPIREINRRLARY